MGSEPSRLFAYLVLEDVGIVSLPTLDGMVEVDQHEYLARYLGGVQNHPQALEALIEKFADCLERGAKLHPLAAFWLSEYLRGNITKKTKRGRPTQNARNLLICRVIERISETTGQVGRSPTSDSLCAFDVVLEALARLRMVTMDYENIKDIWENFQRTRLNFDFEIVWDGD